MLQKLKKYLIGNFEALFVLIVLVTVTLINYFVPYKISFLNFYFIPILFSATYLGRRKTMYGAILCILLVVIFVYTSPDSFITGNTHFDIFFNITTWACFLVLTGAIVSAIQEKLGEEHKKTASLNKQLIRKEQKLEKANKQLEKYSKGLELKVRQRTDSLEKSKSAVENLKQKVEEALYSTMDPAVAKLIIEERIRNEKRKISVLFSDLKGFTSYSEELKPEVVIGDLNQYLQAMEVAILIYRGHIDKYMGDGIMAEFGAPIDYDTHALLAVLAGFKMQEKVRIEKFPWEMRIGIATGNAITGLIGSKRRTYTAIGDVVNLASRLEEGGSPGMVTIDEETYKDIKNFFVVKRKLYIGESELIDDKIGKKLEDLHQKLDENPNDLETNKALGSIYRKINSLSMSVEYYKKALDLAPKDDQIKLAYAETSMEIEKQRDIRIRGKKKTLHLYEVQGLKNPLKDREKIPKSLYDQYAQLINRVMRYPENIILPIEALDGSIGHGKVTGFLAYAIADTLDIPKKEKEDILLAGYLCDIGKEIIPHHILNRRGSLSSNEFEEITKHCEESVRILKKSGYETENAFSIIKSHHEYLNGTGYPKGLMGNKIPLGARIVCVADMYDALTSWRPYRDRWDYRAAYAEIQKGKQLGKFDPQIVDLLGKLLKL